MRGNVSGSAVMKSVPAVLLGLAALLMLFLPLRNIFLYSAYEQYHSYILLIPFVSAFLIYRKRKDIFSSEDPSIKAGGAVMLAGLALYGIGFSQGSVINPDNQSSLLIGAALIFWVGSFLFLYGIRSFRKALFPLLFLGFMIPWPPAMINGVIFLLQVGSTELVEVMFTLMGKTFVREGFVFYTPEIGMEVAPACSGIRSTIALIVTSVLAAWLFLETTWRRLLFFFSIFPLVILKNGIRILTIYHLAITIDERILTGNPLHTFIGILIFIPTIILLRLLLRILRKQEQQQKAGGIIRQPGASLQ